MRKIFILLLMFIVLCCSCSGEPAESISEPESQPQPESQSQPESSAASSSGESTAQHAITSSYVEHLYKKDIKSINCYYGTGAAVLNDGSAVFWGTNVYGGIGNGKIDNDIPEGEKATPVPPYRHCFDEPIIDAGSVASSYALTESGNLYTWGMHGYAYETGQGDSHASIPTKVPNLTDIKQVSMASSFTLALKEDGTVYRSGSKVELVESYEEFEYGLDESKRDKFFTELPLDFKCQKVDTSSFSYVFLSDEGNVYIQGILLSDLYAKMPDLVFKAPTKIDFPEKIVDIAALTYNVVALSESGSVYVFGYPNAGLSNEETDSCVSEMIYKKDLEKIKSIDGSLYAVGALSEDGEIYVWGIDTEGLIHESNIDSQNGKFEIVSEPTKLDYQNITQFCIGRCDGTAISENGDIYIWGSNSIGQIIEFE